LLLQTQHTPIAKKTRSKIKASQTTKSTIINLDGSSSTTSAKTEIEILNVQINRRTTVNTESNSLTVDLNDSFDTNSFLNAYNFETNDFDSNSIRNARFPIATWNVHNRCKLGLPRTNNKVECWHMLINNKATKNLTVYKLIELLRTEQSKVETDLVKLRMGELIKKKLKQDKKDKNLQRLCQNYKKTTNEKLLEYLDYISLNFEVDKIITFDSSSDSN
jgi:hypothetical protein